MKPDSIIFDVDGTLWDCTPVVAEAWNEIFSTRPDVPITMTAEWLTRLFGKTMTDVADILLPFLEKSDRYTLIDNCCKHQHVRLMESDAEMLYPGVEDTIRALAKTYPLFIVSNCQSGYIETFLKKTGLTPCIIDFECPGNTGFGKAENIRLVVERNHLNAPVYVGDIESDHTASTAAGVPFCHASYGFGKVADPDYVIKQFSDLLALF